MICSNATVHSSNGEVVSSDIEDSKEKSEVAQALRTSRRYSRITSLTRKEALAKYIKNRFVQRSCNHYVKDETSRIELCHCGRSREWHEEQGLKPDLSESWDPIKDTTAVVCNTFGEIQFVGFGNDTHNSPYIRLCPKTDPNLIWTMLVKHWKLPVPKLLISITGGAKRFEMKPRLKRMIQRGIVSTAVSTGAWVITGGSSAGVMEIVGEAIQQYAITSGNQDKIVCLGISTWGCIAGRDQLAGYGEEGLFPAVYTMEAMDFKTRKKDVMLDHNHTHFLLVDDGTEGKFGAEIKFRATLENLISDKLGTIFTEKQCVDIPVILLVIEGGINTIRAMYESVENDNPVLVVEGSGRGADFISKGYKLTKTRNDEETIYPVNFDEQMIEFASTSFDWRSDENIEAKIAISLDRLKKCLEKRRLINIFSASEFDFKDLDKAILYALLRANKSEVETQLALSLAWNRCDIARQEIFTVANREEWKKLNMYDAMFTALVQDRADFVQLFIDSGVDFKKFLTKETLWNLYANSLEDTSTGIVQLLSNKIRYAKQTLGSSLRCHETEVHTDLPDLLGLIGQAIGHLLEAEDMNPYSDTDRYTVDEKLEPEMKWIAGDHKKCTSVSSGDDIGMSVNKKLKSDFLLPEKEIFLWAVLLNHKEMANMFWKLSKDHLGGALVASALLKSVAKTADDEEEKDLSLDLQQHAQLFEDRATGVLTECYRMNKTSSHQLLVRKLSLYGNATLLSLAEEYGLMDFMGHSCCQTKLSNLWKGQMSPHTSYAKILSVLLIPLLVPTINFSVRIFPEQRTETNSFDDLYVDDQEPAEIRDAIGTFRRPGHCHGQDDEALNHIFSSGKNRKKVQITGDSQNKRIGIAKAVYHFYAAPVTTYIANIISYLIFLGLFSFFILTNLNPIGYPNSPSTPECVVWFWTATLMLEEVRQIFSRDQRSLVYKVSSWLHSIWNRFDFIMYLMFAISIILRCILDKDNFIWARNFYSVTVVWFYIRFMQIFFVSKNVGPKIIMIKNMLIDLWFFFLIFVIVILSFGVAYHSSLFPNAPVSWNILKEIIYMPYWQIYGELFLDVIQGGDSGSGCTANRTVWETLKTMERCPEYNPLAPLLLAVYMIVTSIILVNLLIAMFSYTFSAVQDNCEKVWKFYRMSLIYEYFDRPILVPPFIILSHIFCFTQWVIHHIREEETTNEFKQQLSDKENTCMSLFERAAMENYLNITHFMQQQQLDNKISTTAERMDKVIEELQQIKEQTPASAATNKMADPDNTLSPTGMKKMVQTSIEELYQQNAHQDIKMDQMLELMELVIHQQALFFSNTKETENQDSMFTSGI